MATNPTVSHDRRADGGGRGSHRARLRPILELFALAMAWSGLGLGAAQTHLPVDADPTWWSQAQQTIRALEYEAILVEPPFAVAAGPTYQMANRVQNLRAHFHAGGTVITRRTEAGPEWQWRYRPLAFGRADRLEGLVGATPSASGPRLELAWATGMVEVYENRPAGIKQSFLVERRPSGEGPLLLQAEFTGDLEGRLAADGRGLEFDLGGNVVLRYAELIVRDAEGTEFPARLQLRDRLIELRVQDDGAHYPLTIDPTITGPGLTNGSPASVSLEGSQEGELFAWSVNTAGDVNGDGYSDVAVGAIWFDFNGDDAGRVFVFHGSSTGLSPTPAWTAVSDLPYAWMGAAVGSAGDVNGDGFADLIVGSSEYGFTGRVDVYHGSPSGLSLTPNWSVLGSQAVGSFGWSAVTAGDVNGDGFGDVLIGAWAYTNGEFMEGVAFLYHGSASGLSLTPNWMAEGNQSEASFGWSVAGAGDLNGDGYADVAVGADLFTGSQVQEGRVFVYHGSAGGLATMPTWTAQGEQEGAQFGSTVAFGGDVNGDGYADLLVGAPWHNGGQVNEGAAFVFQGSATGLSAGGTRTSGSPANADWTREGDQRGAQTGQGLATAGDVNGDGFADVVVGAPNYLIPAPVRYGDSVFRYPRLVVENTTGFPASSFIGPPDDTFLGLGGQIVTFQFENVHILDGPGGDFNVYEVDFGGVEFASIDVLVSQDGLSFVSVKASEGPVVRIPGDKTHGNDAFARSYDLAVSGFEAVQFVKIDGVGTGAAGGTNGFDLDAIGAVNLGFPSGRAELFLGSATGLATSPHWTIEGEQIEEGLGRAVATAGDVNGDGYSDLIVAQYRADATAEVLYGLDATTKELLTIDPSTGAATPIGLISTDGETPLPVVDIVWKADRSALLAATAGPISQLHVLDPDSGRSTRVELTGLRGELRNLEFHGDGRLFATNRYAETPRSGAFVSQGWFTSVNSAGILGEYYDNINFTALTLSRIDSTINFNFGSGSPDVSMGADTFSIRWIGTVRPPTSGVFTFYTVTDDGVRLWVNDQLIIDRFFDQGATEWTGSISLAAGVEYPVRMDYFENGGAAVATLSWSGPGVSKQIIPASVLERGFRTGILANAERSNAFFIFNIAEMDFALDARLRLKVAGYQGGASETLQIYDVSATPATLRAGGFNGTVLNDLQSGNLYGSATVTAGLVGSIIEITLSAQAVADMNAARAAGATEFAVGAHLSTAATNEWVILAVAPPIGHELLWTNLGLARQTLDQVDRGWHSNSPSFPHSAVNQNTLTGHLLGGALLRSYFTFNVSLLDLTTLPVVKARLRLELEAYNSPDGSETIRVYDVSTPAATLDASGFNLDVFNDLGTGNVYAQTVLSSANVGSIIEMTLSDQAIADLFAASGTFSVGLNVETIAGQGNEWVRFSSGNEARTHQLVLELSSGNLVTLNLSNGSLTTFGNPQGIELTGLAYNPDSATFFGISRGQGGAPRLFDVLPNSGARVELASLSIPAPASTLERLADGRLLAAGGDGRLFAIDSTAYDTSLVGQLGEVSRLGSSSLTEVIGGPGRTDRGQAIVYYGSGRGLSDSPTLAFESDGAEAELGFAVSRAGDVNGDGYADLIVGAPGFDNGATAQGRAFLFAGGPGGPASSPAWAVSPPAANSRFAFSLGDAGDVNGDGYGDVIVGAPFQSFGQNQEGRAYVFHGSPSGLSLSADWTAESDQAGARLGWSVGAAGDANGDGFGDVIVGAPGFDESVTDEGKAYVFLGSSTGLSLIPSWTAVSGQPQSEFGAAVAAAGDVNRDGYTDVVVAAPAFSAGQAGEGRIFVYHGGMSGPTVNAVWTAESNQIGARFGAAVVSAGDVNGDGFSDLAVGARLFDFEHTDEGAVFVFHGSATGLSADGTRPSGQPVNADFATFGGQPRAHLGQAVAGAGDMNNDGWADLIVGAPGHDVGQSTLFSENFEGASAADWTTTGFWHLVQQGVSPFPEANSPTHSFWYGRDATGNYDNGQTNQGDLRSPAISLPAGRPAFLTFYSWERTEGGTFFDRRIVFVDAGQGLVQIHQTAFNDATWRQLGPIDLTAFAGQTIRLVFRFDTIDSIANNFRGWYVDDVVIRGDSDRGRALAYLGSGSGLDATPAWIVTGDQDREDLGSAVAGLGDVDGDGFGDVAAGGPGFSNGENREGRLQVFLGNHGGLDLIPRQRDTNNTRPIARLGASGSTSDFSLSVAGRSPFGRHRGRLQWEVKPLGVPLDGTGLIEGTDWADLDGSDLNELVNSLSANTAHHWRVRLLYDPSSMPLAPASRWLTSPWDGLQEADLRTAATSGTVIVTVDPQQASWRLVDGLGIKHTGTGNAVRIVPAGTVTIFWEALQHHDTPLPNSESRSLANGQTVMFEGTYTRHLGNVVVNVTPAGASAASWTLVDPLGDVINGSGSASYMDVPAGVYQITWGSLSGFARPFPDMVTQTLNQGATITFNGAYTAARNVQANLTPDDPAPSWTVTDSTGRTHQASGDQTLADVALGAITFDWLPLVGYAQPFPESETLTLNAGAGAFMISRTYRQMGTVQVFVTPDDASWELVDGQGRPHAGQGNDTRMDIAIGTVTVNWQSLAFHDSPSPPSESQTLTISAPITFTGLWTRQTGTLGIDVTVEEPSGADGPWELSGPDGLFIADSGTRTLIDAPAGEYALMWFPLADRSTPYPEIAMATLFESDVTTITGVYRTIGQIAVDVTPNTASWIVTDSQGRPFAGTGDALGGNALSGVATGLVEMAWQPLINFDLPPDPTPTVTLAKGATETFTGVYTRHTGTIEIVVEPPEANADGAIWSLDGPPDAGVQAGTGSTTLNNMFTGQYVITWLAPAGWAAPYPDQEIFTLEKNDTVTVSGTFSRIGTVVVDVTPDTARWSFTDGIGRPHTGTGDATITNAAVGTITLTWDDLTDHDTPTPNPASQTLAMSDTITFTGVFERHTGTIIVDVTPDQASWTLTGPDGYTQSATGDFTDPNAPTGTYSLAFDPLTGYALPFPNPLERTLAKGETRTLIGLYSLITGTVIVDVTPNNAPWTLTDGMNMTQMGAGDATVEDVPVGNVSVFFEPLADYDQPAVNPASGVLMRDDVITLTGVYTRHVGTVVVDVTPSMAGWQLSGPDDVSIMDVGSTTLPNMPTGNYEIDWLPLDFYDTPTTDPLTATLARDEVTTLTGIFTRQTGNLGIAVIPDDACWELSGPDGLMINDCGTRTLAATPTGQYTITWVDYTGRALPYPQPHLITLEKDENTTVTGHFREVGLVIVDVTPAAASWSFTDGSGRPHAGSGDATLADIAEGDITLTWQPLADHDPPPTNPETQTLLPNGFVLFTGLYARHAGLVTVNVFPPEACWVLQGPDSVMVSDCGPQTLPDMPTGNYTLTWQPLADWIVPATNPASGVLAKDDVLAFDDLFTPVLGVLPPIIGLIALTDADGLNNADPENLTNARTITVGGIERLGEPEMFFVPDSVHFSESEDFASSVTLAYVGQTTESLTLVSPGDGVKVVWAALSNVAGLSNKTSDTITLDTAPPIPTLMRIGPATTDGEEIGFSVAFNEPVAPTFTVEDITVTGTPELAAGASVLVSGTDPNYAVTVTLADPEANGSIAITIGQQVYDRAGNAFGGGTSPFTTIFNPRTPTLSGIELRDADPLNNALPTQYTNDRLLTLGLGAITGLPLPTFIHWAESSDLSSSVTLSYEGQTTFTVTLLSPGDGPKSVWLALSNEIGRGNIVMGSIELDTQPPSAQIQLSGPPSVAVGPVSFLVGFTESVGSSFAAEDVTLTGSPEVLAGAQVELTGGGQFFIVTVTPEPAVPSGELGIAVAGGVYDLAGNPLPPIESPRFSLVARAALGGISLSDVDGLNNLDPLRYTNIRQVNIGLLGVSGSPIDRVRLAENPQLAFPTEVPYTGQETVPFTLSAGDGLKTVYAALVNLAGATSTTSDTITLDTTPPVATITLDDPGTFTLGRQTLTFGVNFSEPVAPTFTTADIRVIGLPELIDGAVVMIAGKDPSYVVTVRIFAPAEPGQIRIRVGSEIYDHAGNAHGGATSPGPNDVPRWRLYDDETGARGSPAPAPARADPVNHQRRSGTPP